MERDVEAHDRSTASRRRTLDDDDFRDLAVLPKILVRPEGRNELWVIMA